MTSSFTLSLAASICLLQTASLSLATPGDLDPSFGSGGKVITDFGGSGEVINSVAVQSDGGIVVAGYSKSGIALARYTSTGVLDPSFGAQGKVITPVGSCSANGMVLQADGRILVAGYFANATTDMLLARYNTDGTPDGTFGNATGKVTLPFGNVSDLANCVALQNGGILIAGSSGTDFALARFDSSGKIDQSFGSNGKASADFGGGDVANSIAIQDGNKILLAGYTNNDFALVRFTVDGKIDNNFGPSGNGRVTTDFGGTVDAATGIVILPDGRILAVGSSQVAGTMTRAIALVCYTSDGKLDPSFGTLGKTNTDFGSGRNVGNSVAVDGNGRILVAGFALNSMGNEEFLLARYTSDGKLDFAFGYRGEVGTPFGDDYAEAWGMAVQPDGKIVLAGGYDNGVNYDFALARYLSVDPVVPPTPRVSVAGKKKLATTKSKFVLKGSATDVGGQLSRVEIKIGKAAYKPARGTSSWNFTARLRPGRNKLLIRAVDITGLVSSSVTVTITRK